MKFSYLLVHLGVQQDLGGLLYQGVPLIETKKRLNNPTAYDIKQICEAMSLLLQQSQLVRICVPELWYIVLVHPQWAADILLCFQSSFIHRCVREWIKVEGQADLSPLFLELLGDQMDLGVHEGPAKYKNSDDCFALYNLLTTAPLTTATMSLKSVKINLNVLFVYCGNTDHTYRSTDLNPWLSWSSHGALRTHHTSC